MRADREGVRIITAETAGTVPLRRAEYEQLVDAGLRVRVGHPVALSEIDEPEPDIAVVADRSDRYRAEHPDADDVRLIVEVAHRSLGEDLGEKAGRYALAGIAEYRVVDLLARRTIVHREAEAATGGYRSVGDVAFGEPLEPISLPGTAVVVA